MLINQIAKGLLFLKLANKCDSKSLAKLAKTCQFHRHYSIVPYSTVQFSAVQFSAVQCSAVQCSAVQCIEVQCSEVQCSAVQCSTGHCEIQLSACTVAGMTEEECNLGEDRAQLSAVLNGGPVHSLQCTVYSVQCALYSIHCTIQQCIGYNVNCTLYIVTGHSLQCTVYIVYCSCAQFTVNSVHCTHKTFTSTLYTGGELASGQVKINISYTNVQLQCVPTHRPSNYSALYTNEIFACKNLHK